MKTKIEKLFEDIKNKKNEITKEYEKLKEKYGFKIEGKKIVFNSSAREENKKFKKSILESIFSAKVREILSVPFIYSMIIPTLILHLFLFIYQQTAFRLYKIPLVKFWDYVIFDRKQLDYLNILQKFNCLYCSYVNWLYQYGVEIAWRTEKYWCPIKHAKKKAWEHSWEQYFADYWDAKWFEKIFTSIKEFEKIKKD